MRLTVIGCSGSFPGPDSPASCYLVQADGFSLVLDFGNGALGPLQRYIGLYDVDAVLLSHLHADHCLDLCGYWVARYYAEGGPRPRIPVYGPAGAGERIARAYDLDPSFTMDETYDFRTVTDGVFHIGPFEVTAAAVTHPVEAYAFRISRGGASFAYSGDTGECGPLIRLARGTDLLLAEASFLDRPDLPPGVHITAREAGECAVASGARRLVLTHIRPGTDPAAALAEAKASGYRGPIESARTGAVYELH
jgi:ribonuclease BN (tRNA processing enzyme)